MNIWSDLDHRFISDAGGNLKIVRDIDAVATSIDNILRTSKGERFFLPQFGGSLKDVLFTTMHEDIVDLLILEVEKAITTWDNRVQIIGIDFVKSPDQNAVSLEVEFIISGNDKILKYSRPILLD